MEGAHAKEKNKRFEKPQVMIDVIAVVAFNINSCGN